MRKYFNNEILLISIQINNKYIYLKKYIYTICIKQNNLDKLIIFYFYNRQTYNKFILVKESLFI